MVAKPSTAAGIVRLMDRARVEKLSQGLPPPVLPSSPENSSLVEASVTDSSGDDGEFWKIGSVSQYMLVCFVSVCRSSVSLSDCSLFCRR